MAAKRQLKMLKYDTLEVGVHYCPNTDIFHNIRKDDMTNEQILLGIFYLLLSRCQSVNEEKLLSAYHSLPQTMQQLM